MEKVETQKLILADSVLAQIITTIPPPAIESTKNVFHDLMSCILEQQVHYRSTKQVFMKMLEAAKIDQLHLENFPVFEELAFKNLKLAESKYETIANVLSFWQENTIEWEILSDEDVRKTLGSIKGIGPWTIDMILLYTLQRPNVCPYDDFHLKQIMVSLYNLDEKVKLKAQMKHISEKWGEQKSLAVLYLLHWKTWNKENAKKSKNR